jgi:hypothetical protein
MSRQQIVIGSILIVLFMFTMTLSVTVGKLMLDGAGLHVTKTAVRYTDLSWRLGNPVNVGKGIRNTIWLAFDGGLRLQVANYYLGQTARLQSRGELAEAVDICMDAVEVLGYYDNNNRVYLNCKDLYLIEKGYK